MTTPHHYLLLSAALFAIGVAIVIVRRHPLVVLLGIQVALQAVNLAAAALTSKYQDWDGQVLVLVLTVVSAVEFSAGLGVAFAKARQRTE